MIAYRTKQNSVGAWIVQYRKDNKGPWKNVKHENHNGTPCTTVFWGRQDALNYITQQGGDNGQN